MEENTLRGLAGGVIILLGFVFCYLVSRFATRTARKKSEIYGIPEPKIPFVGLFLPAPFRMKKPQDVAYRSYYFNALGKLLLQSAVLWTLMILLARV